MPSQPSLSPSSPDPDLDLVEAVRRGSSAAFDDLVRRHEARVVRLCGRILGDADTALDAAQEAFVKAWRGLARFAGDARFSTWLTRIAINQCRNELRRRRTVKHQPLLSLDATRPGADAVGDESLVSTLAASGPTPYEHARGREVAAALEIALTELDDEAREVLLLRDAEHLSYDDIAEVLEVPIGTVRSRLHRARGDLHRRLAPTLADVAPSAAPDVGVPAISRATLPATHAPTNPVPTSHAATNHVPTNHAATIEAATMPTPVLPTSGTAASGIAASVIPPSAIPPSAIPTSTIPASTTKASGADAREGSR